MIFSEQKANLIKALVEARKVMSSGAKKMQKPTPEKQLRKP